MVRVFSGIQPTGGGIPHLGNYIGAIKGYVSLQENREAFYCVVDQHATTMPYNPKTLSEDSRTTAAALIACGINPDKAVLFRQSAVHGHSLLAGVLGHIATLGPLERMTQFKEKGRTLEGDQRDTVGLGLLTYPVLMAADIGLYHGQEIPVGDDQDQHLQFAREILKRFNHLFAKNRGGRYFPMPMPIHRRVPRIMSLRDPCKKMSKSDKDTKATIYLMDSIDEAARKYRSAVTSSELSAESIPSSVLGLDGRPALSNLISILAELIGQDMDETCMSLSGKGFSDLKEALIQAHEEYIVPIGRRMADIIDDREGLTRILARGAERARVVSDKTIQDVYEMVGYS
jgi:tryptophanyl-tRNA synthetase